MIEVRSLLRQPDGSFEPYEDCAVPPADPDYVEGAIELVIDGVEVIGLDQWDLVDQLWAYIAEMLKQLREKDEVRTYFPDMPLELAFQRTSPGRLLVTCGERRAQVEQAEFVAVMKTAGIGFFEKLSTLLPGNAESNDLAVDDLRQAVHPR